MNSGQIAPEFFILRLNLLLLFTTNSVTSVQNTAFIVFYKIIHYTMINSYSGLFLWRL